MENFNTELNSEAIIEKYNGTKVSKELEDFLSSKDIPFEVVDGIVCMKLKPFKHDLAKNVLGHLINQELKKMEGKSKSLIELHILRGENFGEDFLLPDISVLSPGKGTCGSNGMYLGTPQLIVEIMSSYRDDMLHKKRWIYEEMGIPEYWIVDLNELCITQFVLKNGNYGEKNVLHTGENIRHYLCGLSFEVEDIFGLIEEEFAFFIEK